MSGKAQAGEHTAMVQALARGLPRSGLRGIRADAPGFPRPDRVNGETPDVTGRDNRLHVFATATADELRDPASAPRWAALAAYTARTGTTFYLAVPGELREEARRRLRELGINARVMAI